MNKLKRGKHSQIRRKHDAKKKKKQKENLVKNKRYLNFMTLFSVFRLVHFKKTLQKKKTTQKSNKQFEKQKTKEIK